MLVKKIMNTDVLTVDPDITIQEASRIMIDNDIGSLVITKGSMVQGIITYYDIVAVIAKGRDVRKERVSNVMTPYVYTVTPQQKLETAIKIMKRRKIKKLPVMVGRRLIGIITATDIITGYPKMIEELKSVMRKWW